MMEGVWEGGKKREGDRETERERQRLKTVTINFQLVLDRCVFLSCDQTI